MAVLIKITGSGNGVLKPIAEAIGDPAAKKDKKERLAEIIDNAQKDIASLCNEKGCNIPAHPTFPDIISGLNKVTHFLQSAQISSLSAQVGFSEPGKMILSWKNPISDQNYSGVMIRYKAGSYPTSQTDGTLVYDSNGTLPASETATVTGLSDGMSYYVRGFAYAISGASRIYTTSTTGAQCTAIPRQLKGQQVFTASGTFIVPYGVTKIDVFLVGGGSAGNTRGRNQFGMAGGAGGYTTTLKNISVIPFTQANITIGAGGIGQTIIKEDDVLYGGNGGISTFNINGNIFEAKGAIRGDVYYHGHNGGSGGGASGINNSYEAQRAGDGGSNGSDGASNKSNYKGGTGQKTTTRAFGEANGTLYAGGGGGVTTDTGLSGKGGVGGGTDGIAGMASQNCTANTGGGSGACCLSAYQDTDRKGNKAGNGGSGIVIVRWGY